MALVLDTHALVWYLSDSPQLSSNARLRIADSVRNEEDIFVSAISLVEVVYVCERGRLPMIAWQKLATALKTIYASIVVAALDHHVAALVQSVPRAEVPDMPDRIIAATALHLNAPLVKRDRKLQRAAIQTIW